MQLTSAIYLLDDHRVVALCNECALALAMRVDFLEEMGYRVLCERCETGRDIEQ